MTNANLQLAPLRVGDRITPSLQLLRPLGAGGMGSVWIADHLGLRTHVVVKFMADHIAENPEAIARFSREAAAASQVRSPHVVQMIDHGLTTDGRPFIAMELLEGGDLASFLAQRRTLPSEHVVTIITHVARALSKAHERGIIHRDIKPENIFLMDAGGGELFAKVLDFGVAKSMFTAPSRGTATGAMIGTPYYMAPEQILGTRTIDASADLWALAVVTFEALTGTLPFYGETVGAISVAICSDPIPVPTSRNPALPHAIDTWFQQACSRTKEHRFSNALQLADALRVALSGQRQPVAPPAPPPPPESMSAAPTVTRQPRPTTGSGVSSAMAALPESPPRRRWIMPAAIASVVALVGALGVAAYQFSRPEPAAETDTPRRTKSKPESPAAAAAPPASETTTAPAVAVDAVASASASASAVALPSRAPAPLPVAVAAPKPPLPSSAAPPVASSTTLPPTPAAPPTPSPPSKKKKDVVLE